MDREPQPRGPRRPTDGTQERAGHKLNPDLLPKLSERGLPQHFEDVNWHKEEAAIRNPALRFMWLIGALVPLVAIAGYAWQFFRSEHDVTLVRSEAVPSEAVDIQAVQGTLDQFLAAESIEESLKLVRDPEMTASRMERWKASGGEMLQGGEISNFSSLAVESATSEGNPLLYYNVLFKDISARTAIVEMTEDGPKLDWESFVFYAELPWEQYLAKQPKEPIAFRVRCTRGNYFNNDYIDSEYLLCLRLTVPHSDASCWGYLKWEMLFSCYPAQKIAN